MKERLIRICYRKIIDSSSSAAWEQFVFDDTYQEFLLQAQLYNQEKKYTSFAQLRQHAKGAESLHFLVSAAITGYMKQLEGIIPDVTNALGKTFLPFHNYRFEIINSDIKDKGRHQIAINFYSDELTWIDTIGSQLLIALANKSEDGAILTELILLQPFVSIYSVKNSSP